ncbi:hypothetical protein [Halalkalibacter oceani]|uniref:hypothetical protein n=1 Tax=Halalkalibacter oceani TaxID=1653776 RepID=UPI003397B642
MTYNNKELITKQDYIDQLNDLLAYAELEGEDFDFGTGLIVNEMSMGSEDAYYKMYIQALMEKMEFLHIDNSKSKRKKKKRLHKRDYKKKEKERLKKLSEISWMNVNNREGWKQRSYRGKRSRHFKKQSHRKIRRYKGDISLKGNMTNKIFDFWWKLY